MDDIFINILGIIAGVCTTVSFVPQVVKIFKTKQVRDISLCMYIILTTGILLWLIYGIFLGKIPIILANIMSFILCVFVIVMKKRHGGKTER